MPAETVSQEVRHLIRDKGYEHDRAVAAALSMKRAGTIRGGDRMTKRKPKRGGRRY